MKKRVYSLLLAMLMIVSACCISGCKKSGKDSFTYWCKMHPSVATNAKSYNEIAAYKALEEKTGVHIEFSHPPIGTETEQFKLLFVANDMPDFIEYGWSNYTGGPQQAIDDGMILDISEYLEYAPNLKAAIEGDSELAKEWKKATVLESGAIYGFPTLNVGDYRTFCGITVRKDWLDELGLEVPETIDEWTTVLRAFKEKKGAKAPMTGDLTWLLNAGSSTVAGAFGIGNRFYVEDGKVKYGPLQDEYKEFLETLRLWYSEGLLDKDIATNKNTLIDNKMLSGESGALLYTAIGGGIGKYMRQKASEDPSYNLVAAPYPVKNKGEINKFPIVDADVNTSAVVAISASCEDPVAAVKWLDNWYSEEGYYLMNFGVEGVSYEMVDGKPVYTDLILNNPDGLSISEALSLNCRATAPAPGFQQAPEYLEQYYEYQQQKDALKLWSENVSEVKQYKLPNTWKSAKDTSRISEIQADLDTYIQETLWKFVIGEKSLNEFDEFRNTLKTKFHIEEYIEIEQKYYDSYNK